MTRWAIGLVACAAACGDNAAAPGDASHDAPVVATVTGTLVEVSSHLGADGQPVTDTAPRSPTATHLTVTLADGATAPVTLADDGAFSFGLHAAAQPYRLVMALDGGPTLEVQSAAPTLRLALLLAGRATRAAAAQVAIKSVVGNWTDGDTAFLATTGLWTDTQAGFVTAPAPQQTEPWGFQWLWSAAQSLSGPLGLLDGAQGDALWLTAWRLHLSPTYTAIAAAFADPAPTLTPGVVHHLGTDAAPATLSALPQACLHVVAPRGAELARVTAALPDTYVAASDRWTLAVPAGADLGADGAQPIAIGSEPGTGSDADLTASFGNPFGGAQLLIGTAAHQTRALAAQATDQPAYVDVGTQTWAAIAAPTGCAGSAALATAVPDVAIPGAPVLAGTALDHDGVSVISDGTPMSLTWSDAAAGAADAYTVVTLSVTSEAGQSVVRPIRTIVTTERSVALDPAAIDGANAIEIVAERGRPGAGSGDFRTRTFPAAQAVAWSHLFRVVVPL